MQVQTVNFILITEIVGDDTDFFVDLIESEPGFSWGDNNRTLVTAQRVVHAMNSGDLEDAYPAIYERLKSLEPNTYIDLEN